MNWRSFLILHGVENWRPREHWQWWLAARVARSRRAGFLPTATRTLIAGAGREDLPPEAGHLRCEEDVFMGDEQQQQSNRRRFTEEFKRNAVNLVRSTGRPIAAVGRELGIYDSTLGNWVRQDRIDRGEAEGLTTEVRARLRQLEAENARLRMEPDLLKRTVAFWVKEQSTR
jgi:transposase